jgi:hypothetical protein
VDGIPHIAFLSNQAEVKTALIGAVPNKILQSDFVALIQVFIYLLFFFQWY